MILLSECGRARTGRNMCEAQRWLGSVHATKLKRLTVRFGRRAFIGVGVSLAMPACSDESLSCDNWNAPDFFLGAKPAHLEHCLEAGDIEALDAWGNGPIHASVVDHTGESFIALVRRGGNVNQTGFRGNTPLMYAVQFSSGADLMEIVIAAGADVNAVDERGMTALAKAAELGRDEQLEALLEAGAIADMATRRGATPLYLAVERGHMGSVFRLLAHGADANGDRRRSPLHAAVKAEAFPMISTLLDAGANPNGGHDVPLVAAARSGNIALLHILAEKGADVNQSDWRDITPLEAAARGNSAEAVRWLLRNGARVRPPNDRVTVLFWLLYNEQPNTAALKRLIVAGADTRWADPRGNEPLHYVAGGNDLSVARRLLDAGADTLAGNQFGLTPLHLAASGGSLDMLTLLIHATPSNINPIDLRGRTPLHYAAVADRSVRVLEALLKAGASSTARDRAGNTAYDLAEYWSTEPAAIQALAGR